MAVTSNAPDIPQKPDIVVLGAGAAGLGVAVGAAQLGLKVVLAEAGKMGGECLNTACVPSKALLAAAARTAAGDVQGFGKVMKSVQTAIDTLAPHDSQQRMESLGITVLRERGNLAGPRTVQVGNYLFTPRFVVLATGSAPLGLSDILPKTSLNLTSNPLKPPQTSLNLPVLTSDNLFQLTTQPKHLLVVGGGPMGCEMAQAFARLGSKVTLVERETILPQDDSAARTLVRAALEEDGVKVLEKTTLLSAEKTRKGMVQLVLKDKEGTQTLTGSHLLLAAGRKPRLEGLGLEAAGIAVENGALKVDNRLRTTNKRVFAVGDITGPHRFTHMAAYQAGVVVRQLAFRLPARVHYGAVPRCTFTAPEVAQIGLTEAEAKARHGNRLTTITEKFADNDRAVAEGMAAGFIKLMLVRGRLVGATACGPHAGDLLAIPALMMSRKLKLSAIAATTLPYPTRAEIFRRAAATYYKPLVFGGKARALVASLKKLLP